MLDGIYVEYNYVQVDTFEIHLLGTVDVFNSSKLGSQRVCGCNKKGCTTILV